MKGEILKEVTVRQIELSFAKIIIITMFVNLRRKKKLMKGKEFFIQIHFSRFLIRRKINE